MLYTFLHVFKEGNKSCFKLLLDDYEEPGAKVASGLWINVLIDIEILRLQAFNVHFGVLYQFPRLFRLSCNKALTVAIGAF